MTYSFSQWLMCRLQGALRGASLREGRTMDGKEHLFEMVDIHGLADGSRGVVQDTVTGQVYEVIIKEASQ